MFHLALFSIRHFAAVSQVIGTHIVFRAEAVASALYFANCYAHVGSAMNDDQGAPVGPVYALGDPGPESWLDA